MTREIRIHVSDCLEEAPRQHKPEVTEDEPAGSDVIGERAGEEPDAETAKQGHEKSHAPEHPDPTQQHHPAEHDERDGVDEQMTKPVVQKWGADDPHQAGRGARTNAVTVEVKERQKIQQFHGPHDAEKREQKEEVILDRLNQRVAGWNLLHRLRRLLHKASKSTPFSAFDHIRESRLNAFGPRMAVPRDRANRLRLLQLRRPAHPLLPPLRWSRLPASRSRGRRRCVDCGVKFSVMLLFALGALGLAEESRTWPAQTVAPDLTVQLVEEDAAARQFAWESAHFRIASDLKLPLGIVRDLAAVFEATREVIVAVPLGLHTGGEREKYRTRLFSDSAAYRAAGGAAATGGYFDGREMLILLPNLGITTGTNGLTRRVHEKSFRPQARGHASGPGPLERCAADVAERRLRRMRGFVALHDWPLRAAKSRRGDARLPAEVAPHAGSPRVASHRASRP